MNKLNLALGVALVAMLVAIGGYFYPSLSSSFGATTVTGQIHRQAESFQQGLQVGRNGTVLTNAIRTTCSMIADNSITASTTGYAYCTGITGVTSSDLVLAAFSTSTLGWRPYLDNIEIISAKASTTAGAIDFILYNGTGATQAPSAVNKTGSTTVIYVGH